ncbi:MAG: transposase [Planctomycetes bacterium]|nr:transposase [Planctomycetota bacterium]
MACSFRKPWRNGVEGVRLDPQTFLSRLAAQVPPPRAHQVTYHGILAPASPCRSMVVPEVAEADSSERACGFGNRVYPRRWSSSRSGCTNARAVGGGGGTIPGPSC